MHKCMNKDCIRNDFNTDDNSKNGCFEYDLINDCKIFLRSCLTEKLPDNNIFSGDYSEDMWEEINTVNSFRHVQEALYTIGCRLQEFESATNERIQALQKKEQ